MLELTTMTDPTAIIMAVTLLPELIAA